MESLFSRRVLRTRGRRAAARGFTLIEMLVVLVIIVIISAIALSGQTTFSRTEALNNAAYDIGLSIREAQSYGLSNSLNKGSTSAFYNVPFGIALGGTTDTTHYVLFQDISPGPKCNTPACPSGNGEYDPNASPPDVAVKTYALNNGFSFASFCAFDGANTVCSTDSPNPITEALDNVRKPNGQAAIAAYTASQGWKLAYTYACMKISSGSGDYRYVSVSANDEVLAGIKTSGDPLSKCP